MGALYNQLVCILSVLCFIFIAEAVEAQTRKPSQKRMTPAQKAAAAKEAELYKDYMPRDRAPKLGDVGKLNGDRIKVVQVVDDSSVLAEVEWYETYLAPLNPSVPLSVPVSRSTTHSELVWLQTGTSGMIDGKFANVPGKFEVVGTKRYETSNGPRTVQELRPWKNPKDLAAKADPKAK